MLQSVKPVKKQSEYQGYRAGPTDQSGSNHTMPIVIGAAMIAAAILLSTLVTALGRAMSGSRPERGKRLADRSPDRQRLQVLGPGTRQGLLRAAEVATGSIIGRGKR